MKSIKRSFAIINDYIYDSSIYIKDRTFVLFSLLYFAALIEALLVGLFLREPLPSTLISLGVVVISIVALYFIVKHDKIKQAKAVVAFLMVFFFQPAMFFAKGGIYCGAPFTLLLGTYYLVLILDGRLRFVMCVIDGVVLTSLYVLGYLRPDLVTVYSREADFIYSLAKYVIVILVITTINVFQTRIYQQENRLAEENPKSWRN